MRTDIETAAQHTALLKRTAVSELKDARCSCGAVAIEVTIDRRGKTPSVVGRCLKHREAPKAAKTLAERKLELALIEARR